MQELQTQLRDAKANQWWQEQQVQDLQANAWFDGERIKDLQAKLAGTDEDPLPNQSIPNSTGETDPSLWNGATDESSTLPLDAVDSQPHSTAGSTQAQDDHPGTEADAAMLFGGVMAIVFTTLLLSLMLNSRGKAAKLLRKLQAAEALFHQQVLF